MTGKICTYGASTRELRQGSLGLRSSHCRLRGQVSTVGTFKGVIPVRLVVLKAVIEAFHLEGLGVSCRHTQHRLPWQPRIPWGMEQLQFLPSLRQMVEWRREDTQRCTDCTACKGLEPDESAVVGLLFSYLDVPGIITPTSKLFSRKLDTGMSSPSRRVTGTLKSFMNFRVFSSSISAMCLDLYDGSSSDGVKPLQKDRIYTTYACTWGPTQWHQGGRCSVGQRYFPCGMVTDKAATHATKVTAYFLPCTLIRL
jgi:hypothetical protein